MGLPHNIEVGDRYTVWCEVEGVDVDDPANEDLFLASVLDDAVADAGLRAGV